MWPVRLLKFLKSAGRDGLVLLFALRDPGTPSMVKAGIVALALYTVSPIDLLPDMALLLGWADDLALLMLGIPFLVKRLPVAVRARASLRAEQVLGRFGGRRA
jgi:uncharacterized membrane protein YkvA (DUF1232 family)